MSQIKSIIEYIELQTVKSMKQKTPQKTNLLLPIWAVKNEKMNYFLCLNLPIVCFNP